MTILPRHIPRPTGGAADEICALLRVLLMHHLLNPPVTARSASFNTLVVILGLDAFLRKNVAQLREMGALGYRFHVCTTGNAGVLEADAPKAHQVIRLAASPVARAAQVLRHLWRHRHSISHVEVYPGGRFAFFYAGRTRLLALPLLVVERGDLIDEDSLPRWDAGLRRLCYLLADCVWYREPYQGRALANLGVTKMSFIPNAVDFTSYECETDRDVDFLWVNRLIPQRRADWFATLMSSGEFAHTRGVMSGFLPSPKEPAVAALQDAIRRQRPANLDLHEYADPSAFYRSARYFVLPAEVVFANNALLEAMAHGVVPLVSDVEGARDIVTDGVDGWVFPHTADGLRQAMRRATSTPPEVWQRMSTAAAGSVRARFSRQVWADSISNLYAQLRHRSSRPTCSSASPHDP